MSTEVEVALVGLDVRRALEHPGRALNLLNAEEVSRPWRERRRVTLSVEDKETLASILDRVAQELGVYENTDWTRGFGTGRFVALRNDQSPLPLDERLVEFVTLTDDQGHALWGVWNFESVTYTRLRAAAEAGAMNGDPSRFYFHVRLVPAGGWVPWEWPALVLAWEVAWRVLQAAAVANETRDLYEKLLDRLGGRDVVARKADEWLARNGLPDYIERSLSGESWSARDLAGVLGLTTDEAEAILKLYGYERDSASDRWEYAADLAATTLRTYRRGAASLYNYGDVDERKDEALVELLRAILTEALETGAVDTSGDAESSRIAHARRTNRPGGRRRRFRGLGRGRRRS